MSRKSSGLRNKYRTGRSTYSRLGKSKVADHYGKFVNGKRQEDDRICKHLRAVDSEFFFDEVTAAACDKIIEAAAHRSYCGASANSAVVPTSADPICCALDLRNATNRPAACAS